MKVSLEMPAVQNCEATECAYNREQVCHARAITIGDNQHAACDTMLSGEPKHAKRPDVAGVGACKVASCMYNDDFECQADGIEVGLAQDHADCLTFEIR